MVELTHALREGKIEVSNRQIGQPERGIGRFVCFFLVKEPPIKKGAAAAGDGEELCPKDVGLQIKMRWAISIFHA